jgi:hypothetical protein
MPNRKRISNPQTGRFPSDKPNFANRPQRDGEPSHWTLKQVLPYLHCYKDDPDGPYQFIKSLISAHHFVNPATLDALTSTDQAIIHEVKQRAATFVQDNALFKGRMLTQKESTLLIETAMLIGVSISMEIAAAQTLAAANTSSDQTCPQCDPAADGSPVRCKKPCARGLSERASDRHMRAHCDGSADAE